MPAPRLELAMRATRLHRPTVRTSSGACELTLLGNCRSAMSGDFAQNVGGVQRLEMGIALAAVIVDFQSLVIVIVFEEQSNRLSGILSVANGHAQPVGVPLAAVDPDELHSRSYARF